MCAYLLCILSAGQGWFHLASTDWNSRKVPFMLPTRALSWNSFEGEIRKERETNARGRLILLLTSFLENGVLIILSLIFRTQ